MIRDFRRRFGIVDCGFKNGYSDVGIVADDFFRSTNLDQYNVFFNA